MSGATSCREALVIVCTYFFVTIFRPCTNRVDVVTDLIVDDVTVAPTRPGIASSHLLHNQQPHIVTSYQVNDN